MGDTKTAYPRQEIESAGGVVMRFVDEHPEVILCGRVKPEEWRLPKGTPEPGESREQTAIREVLEETGLETEILVSLGHIEYIFRVKSSQDLYLKRVYFYLMESIGGSTDMHDHEFDVVEWVNAPRALAKISFETEADILQRAVTAFTARSFKANG